MNFGEMLDQVRRAGGMDVDVGLAGIWINERYKRLAIRSGWSKGAVSLGDTVADQSAYALPIAAMEIHELKVGSTPYGRVGRQTLWDLQGSVNNLNGTGGVYAPAFSGVGIEQIEIYPTPDEVAAITAEATVIPNDLANTRDVAKVPPDFHMSICEGAMADAFAYIDENIPAADRYEGRFDASILELMKRRKRKVGGKTQFIQIEGVHFAR